jgi:hypothetical protein
MISTGSVLGVDVGFSPSRRSSAVCRLDWDETGCSFSVERFRYEAAERERVIATVAGAVPLLAAAFDGPLRSGFDVIGRYRTAERMLTRRLGAKIGKPGQSSAPVGRRLNAAANECARVVLARCTVGASAHACRIHELAVVEAFPNAFLGVLLKEPAAVAARRSDRSDAFFEHLVASGGLAQLLEHLLPGRRLRASLGTLTNRDDRAAIVCALTALSVVVSDFTAVGDADGWIVLPPWRAIQPWARSDLMANADAEPAGCLYKGGQSPSA